MKWGKFMLKQRCVKGIYEKGVIGKQGPCAQEDSRIFLGGGGGMWSDKVRVMKA